jgi:hypothetical protein
LEKNTIAQQPSANASRSTFTLVTDSAGGKRLVETSLESAVAPQSPGVVHMVGASLPPLLDFDPSDPANKAGVLALIAYYPILPLLAAYFAALGEIPPVGTTLVMDGSYHKITGTVADFFSSDPRLAAAIAQYVPLPTLGLAQ